MKRYVRTVSVLLMLALLLPSCTPAVTPTEEPTTVAPTVAPTEEPTATPVPTPTPEPITELSQLPTYAQEERPYSECVLEMPEIIWVPEMDALSCKAFYYRIEDYKGQPQYVFAYMGIPAGASAENPCPAVVLVHGGGGTASATWCKYWMAQGFAAISFDWNGDVPSSPNSTTHVRSDKAPLAYTYLGDMSSPVQDQWMYHTISSTMIATTILSKQPEVDYNRMGIAGLSWGGLITSIAIGLDCRYKFAIPLYGCGCLAKSKANFATYGNDSRFKKQWAPELNFGNVDYPVLWIAGDDDAHFSADAISRSHEATPGSTLFLDHGYSHGHNWANPIFFVFAKNALGIDNTVGLPTIVAQPEGLNAKLTYSHELPITKAVCYYRTAKITYKDTANGKQLKEPWVALDCTIDEATKTVSCTLPSDTYAYYIVIGDNRTLRDTQWMRNVTMSACSNIIYLYE